jgi:hypothetical protein
LVFDLFLGGSIMSKSLIFTFAVSLLILAAFVGSAKAACSVPNPLTNGTTADALAVMGNFNTLAGCAAPLASPSFTGTVGIGTASPSVLLDVENPTVNSNVAIIKPASGSTATTKILDIQAGNSASLATFYNGGSGATTLYVNGNVGIGTTSPGYALYVNGSAAGPSGFQTASDMRLKKNIVPLSSGLALIDQLKPVRFEFRSERERDVGKELRLPVSPQVGFLAQDIAKSLPEAVSTAGGKDAIMSVAESKIVPVLVAAVKELKAANDNQVSEIARLQAQVAVLQRKLGVQTVQR